MPWWVKKDVYKVTERRDGAIFKTEKIKSIWLEAKPRPREVEDAIARTYGGDMLVNTHEEHIGATPPGDEA